MKKYILGILLAFTMAGTLAGCGKETGNDAAKETASETVSSEDTGENETDEAEEKESSLDVNEIAEGILNDGDFKDNLALVDRSMALSRLYRLDEAQIEEAAVYTASNATVEEIAVIKAVSADYIETIKTAYETRITEQEDACRDYLPDEIPRLESAVIYTNGNYAVLCVSNDNGKAEDLIKGYFE